MPYKLDGKVIKVGRAFTDLDGVTHPAQWVRYSDAEKDAIGLVWEADPVPFDNRFYWADGVPKSLEDVLEVDENNDPILDEETGLQLVTPGLKSKAITKMNQQKKGLLEPTDFYRIKEADTGEVVPVEIRNYRQAIRNASETIEQAILATTTLEEFIALYDTPVDAEGVPTGNAPINDWPDENNLPVIVPAQVTRRQAKQAMNAAGLLGAVETYMETAPIEHQIEWAEASIFKRNDPLIAGLSATLGLTDEQLDQLFITADSI